MGTARTNRSLQRLSCSIVIVAKFGSLPSQRAQEIQDWLSFVEMTAISMKHLFHVICKRTITYNLYWIFTWTFTETMILCSFFVYELK